MKKLFYIVLTLCSLFVASACAATNLVTNPFFTGTTTTATGWTVATPVPTYGNGFNSALSTGAPTAVSSAGSTEFLSGCVGTACLVYTPTSASAGTFGAGASGAQQALATTVGQQYQISFWTYFSTASNTTVEIDVYWGTTKIYAGTNVATAGWSQHVIGLGAATSSSTMLTVVARDDPSYSAITYIDVEPTLTVTKSVSVVCDPVNANTSPKRIPGAGMQYAITVANTGTASQTLTTITDTLPSTVAFDTKLNSGAAPRTNCAAGNATNSLSSTGFAAHTGTGAGPGVTPPGSATDAVTAGASISGQVVTINFATLATSSITAPAGATLAGGSYITVYFNAFVN